MNLQTCPSLPLSPESSATLRPTHGPEVRQQPRSHQAQTDVICILGIPVDVLDFASALQHMRDAALQRRRCFISTPNLNFLVLSQRDPEFRRSVLMSDLVVADGSALLWIARLLGSPLPERVTGADLFEQLSRAKRRHREEKHIGVYFFGGQPGAAQAAKESLEERGSQYAIKVVGAQGAGFGSVADLSSSEAINDINASGADLLVVALGAMKGQHWILRNLDALNAPVISHLGAVMNFVSGRVRRAPRCFQQWHLEWLWRILQEPRLWRRYGRDTLTLLNLLATKVLPCALWSKGLLWKTRWRQEATGTIHATECGDSSELHFTLCGAFTRQDLRLLAVTLDQHRDDERSMVFDLRRTRTIDLYALGLLSRHWAQSGGRLRFINVPWHLARLISFAGADYLLRD